MDSKIVHLGLEGLIKLGDNLLGVVWGAKLDFKIMSSRLMTISSGLKLCISCHQHQCPHSKNAYAKPSQLQNCHTSVDFMKLSTRRWMVLLVTCDHLEISSVQVLWSPSWRLSSSIQSTKFYFGKYCSHNWENINIYRCMRNKVQNTIKPLT